MSSVIGGSIMVDTVITVLEKGDTWKAFVTPPGTMVRGNDLEEIVEQAGIVSDAMMAELMERPGFPWDAFAYFKARGVHFEAGQETELPQTQAVIEPLRVTKEYAIAERRMGRLEGGD